MVPGRLQAAVEMMYEFVAGILRDATGKEGMRFFPIVFTIFMFILMGNMLGMIPGSFTFTSHIIVTFAMAIAVWLGVTIIGFWYHGAHFLHFFVPQRRAQGDAAAPGADRDPVLLRAPDQPVGPSVLQHDGRPHDAEGVRRLHHQPGRPTSSSPASPRSRSRSS